MDLFAESVHLGARLQQYERAEQEGIDLDGGQRSDAAAAAASRSAADAVEDARRAVEHLEKAGAVRPLEPTLQLALGRLHLATGAADKAVATLESLNEREPGVPQALLLLARAYMAEGNRERAMTLLTETIAQEPDFYAAHLMLAELYEEAKQDDAAAKAYEAASRQNPRSVELKVRRAAALANAGNRDAARQSLRDVLAASPTNPNSLYLLSQVARQLRDDATAEQAARRLMELRPDDIRGPLALVQVYETRYDYAKIVETLTPAVDATRKRNGAARQLGLLLQRLGIAHYELGQDEKAIAVLEEARKLPGADATVDSRLIQAQVAAKQYTRALALVREARAARQNDTRLMFLEAEVLRQSGNASDGLKLLEQAVRERADEPLAYASLAQAYTGAGQLEKADQVLDTAESRFPDNTSVQLLRVELLDGQKRQADAEQLLRSMVAKDPENPQVSIRSATAWPSAASDSTKRLT